MCGAARDLDARRHKSYNDVREPRSLRFRKRWPSNAWLPVCRHNGAQLKRKIFIRKIAPKEPLRHMPSLIRFLVIVGLLGGITFGGLYMLAEYYEPQPRETVSAVPGGVKIRK